MGCGCNKKAAAAKANIVQYEIEGDPDGRKYLTEHEANRAKQTRGLDGPVKPTR